MNIILSVLTKLPTWALIALAACAVVVGDIAAKTWSVSRGEAWYWAALVAYACSGLFYVPTLLRDGLVVTSVLWTIGSIVGFLFVGLVLFKETLSSLQMLGVAFGIISVLLLSWAS
jgi:small multidrug resistance pump